MTSNAVNISNLIKNIRNLGYNLENAIGDLIDNSIDANSNNIWINLSINKNPYFEIIDDGTGMGKDEMFLAMQISGTLGNERNQTALGKFGMGLKTASFAYTKRFEVYSKNSNEVSALCWDIEEKNEFFDINFIDFSNSKQGTKVVWNKIDRFADNLNETFLYTRLSVYISRTFGMIIIERNINIFLNNIKIKAFDPFYEENPKTTTLAKSVENINESKIIIRPYILSSDYAKEIKEFDLFNQQGIYIYRNNRLIGNFGWLNYKRKTEQAKLGRIRYDIDSTIDEFVHISIDKSKFSSLENLLTPSLKKAIDMTINKSNENYKRKGTKRIARATTKKIDQLWEVKKNKNGQYLVKVNRKNHLIEQQINSETNKLITLLEGSIPYQIFQINGDNSTIETTNFIDTIIELALNRFKHLRAAGRTHKEIMDELINNSVIQENPEVIERILEEVEKYDEV